MKKEYNLLLDINIHLIKCKNDNYKKQLFRKYLKYKLDGLVCSNSKKPRFFLLLGIPINLFSF